MKRLNRDGFTLIELLAVLMLLAIIMGIGSYSIIGIIKDSRQKDYELLIENINSAVEEYYIECKYDKPDIIDWECSNEIELSKLVEYGYLKSNSTDGSSVLVNPKDNKKMGECKIKYEYKNGKFEISNVDIGLSSDEYSCPTTCDFKPENEGC